ncbi:MAG: DUF6326 family protein [Candidatus Hermodarchaeota archaeon]
MDEVQIIISALWVATVLCYIYGDVFSLLAGDFKPGEIDGKPLTEKIVLGLAAIMVVPIIMVIMTLMLDYAVNRLINILVALIYFGFNLFSIRGYPIYEKFTLLVSMVFNLLIVYNAWNWI